MAIGWHGEVPMVEASLLIEGYLTEFEVEVIPENISAFSLLGLDVYWLDGAEQLTQARR